VQFGAQEPGSNSDIKSFAKKNYGVTFPLMSKVDVNGQGGKCMLDGGNAHHQQQQMQQVTLRLCIWFCSRSVTLLGLAVNNSTW
jgi:glutathione peroxidase-family protein